MDETSELRRRRFEEIYDLSYQALVGYALRRTADPADAADVVAETFLVAWRRIDDVPAGADARPWLFGVARGVLANQRRGQLRRLRLTEALRADLACGSRTSAGVRQDVADPSDSLPDGSVDADAIARAFGRLSDLDREVLSLVVADGLDRDGVAVALGCSRTAVRVRLHRARARFARELVAEGVDLPGARHRKGADLKREAPSGHVTNRWVDSRPAPEEML